ncbi:hypothetical protein [Curtobacterium sp. MCBA15_012]|uniref:hypothetical protein n=1 Tax=Curtobacterium sp. MCBA15_012 TaxID=1898738 RepID=UPI0011138F75|nr:hypothetical protein [Curtobacterium sp. MCBA15_012]WIB01594.1 hypothetical protein QOL15_07875 [Curtobacterium sp. MCBA15_012]
MTEKRKGNPSRGLLPLLPAFFGIIVGTPAVISALLSGEGSQIASVATGAVVILLVSGLFFLIVWCSFAPAAHQLSLLQGSLPGSVHVLARWTKEGRIALGAGPDQALQRDLIVSFSSDAIVVRSNRGEVIKEIKRDGDCEFYAETGDVFESTRSAPVRRGGVLVLSFDDRKVRLPLLDPKGYGVRFAGTGLTRKMQQELKEL